ncbi:MAG: ribosome silencing factor [Candidatus Aureabacteria bacterium]|nr:ribosome silencing factor [Candidatus Auribacterota bacterium]
MKKITNTKRSWPARKIARIAREAAEAKKAEDIVALDMRSVSSVADVFFICTALNERQVEAIVRSIEESLKNAGVPVLRIEGLPEARWVVMDCGDVLLHVFLPPVRSLYSLETLWGDAPKIFSPE